MDGSEGHASSGIVTNELTGLVRCKSMGSNWFEAKKSTKSRIAASPQRHPISATTMQRSMQDRFEQAQQYGGSTASSSSALSTSSRSSSATDSGIATPLLSSTSASQPLPMPMPMSLSAGVSASLAQQGFLSPSANGLSTSSRSNALQMSPGPFNANLNNSSNSAYELGTSYRDTPSPGGFVTGNDYSEVLGREYPQSFLAS